GGVMCGGGEWEGVGGAAADLGVGGGPRVDVLPFDASDVGSHAAFAARCGELAGTAPLAVLLAFAFMPEQHDVDADPALVRRTVDATFTGAASVLHWLPPRLETQAG